LESVATGRAFVGQSGVLLALLGVLAAPAMAQQEPQADDAAPPETSSTEAAAPPQPREPVVVRHRVLRSPTGEDVSALYPDAAALADLGGRAVVECTVALSTRLEACRVLEEEPKGYGFGDAAVRTAMLYRIAPPTIDGEPVPGTKFRVPVRFAMADGPPRPVKPPPAQPDGAQPAQQGKQKGADTAKREDRPKRPAVRAAGALWAPLSFAAALMLATAAAFLWPVQTRPRRRARPWA
jgi:TonB family protein